jgi:hypothetical protein
VSFSLMCGPAPDDDERLWCDDCGNYGCQCDRDYAAYLVAWSEAIESGEFETTDVFVRHANETQAQEAA